MTTVRDLLNIKGEEIWSVSPEATTLEALKVMAEKKVGALLVMEGEKLVGIVSERDFARRFAEMGACQIDVPVKEYMTDEVYFVLPDMSVNKCMQMMTHLHVRHLPVFEGEKLIGMISIGDVVKEIIRDQESLIQSMENFITGRGYGM
ncbi:MAG TPA: CBS domain-containing protein [Levilinea sp.]|nr:CBS domain-containing protein [Levilinea sp.]